MKKIHFLLQVFWLFHYSSYAVTRNVPASYPTIQAALNACQQNDTIVVQTGTYIENLTWPAVNGINMISSAGAASTIISAGGLGRVLIITSSVIDTSTLISGFTFRDGYLTNGSGYGAGIYITDASVVMNDLVVKANRVFVPGGHGYGAGIHLANSSSRILNCEIIENTIDSASWCYGAGIYISAGSPYLQDVLIANNTANSDGWCYGVGLFARANAIVNMERIIVSGNTSGDNATWYYGNGIYLGNSTGNLVNVLVVSNRSGLGGSFNYGGGIFCDGSTCQVNLMNVTVAGNYKSGNTSITGSGIYVRDANVTATNTIFYNQNTGIEAVTNTPGILTIEYSNVRGGYTGTGNFNLLPGFLSSVDFHLTITSPCTDAGTAMNAPFTDLEGTPRPLPAGTKPDIGCYEVNQPLLGIRNELTETTFYVFPNPVIAGNVINCENISEEIIITDLLGKIIFTAIPDQNKIQIITTGWQPGVYFIKTTKQKSCLILI